MYAQLVESGLSFITDIGGKLGGNAKQKRLAANQMTRILDPLLFQCGYLGGLDIKSGRTGRRWKRAGKPRYHLGGTSAWVVFPDYKELPPMSRKYLPQWLSDVGQGNLESALAFIVSTEGLQL